MSVILNLKSAIVTTAVAAAAAWTKVTKIDSWVLLYILFWLYANISKEHISLIFRVHSLSIHTGTNESFKVTNPL